MTQERVRAGLAPAFLSMAQTKADALVIGVNAFFGRKIKQLAEEGSPTLDDKFHRDPLTSRADACAGLVGAPPARFRRVNRHAKRALTQCWCNRDQLAPNIRA
jgi:hypothetical protein